MIVHLKLLNADGYQEPWPPETEPSTMKITVAEVELRSDDGEKSYTLGRLFFPPEQFAEFGSGIDLSTEDLREEPANV